MSFRLKSLVVENFRSINGQHTIGLDAPIVLVHGPNGVGKTSLLSAIELGLTATAPSLTGPDGRGLEHLPHKESPNGRGRIQLAAEGPDGPCESSITLTRTAIEGSGLLPKSQALFFSERCYLAQSALGRLLEIYQHQDARRSDSALTRFVKELIGLGPLDALIEGLHDSADVRRLRLPAPEFWSARDELPQLTKFVSDAERAEKAASAELSAREAAFQELAGALVEADALNDPQKVDAALSKAVEADEVALTGLARRRRDLQAAQAQIAEATGTRDGRAQSNLEADHVSARHALDAWVQGNGSELDELIRAIQSVIPDIPPVANGAAVAHQRAVEAVKAERVRLESIVSADVADAKEQSTQEGAIRQGDARIAQIDSQIAGIAGSSQELAQALAAVAPHIHDENCPVCGRDFQEVSPERPLSAHVSDTIANLVDAASRLQALARERSTTAGAVAEAQRRLQAVSTRRLSSERVDSIKSELAALLEWDTGLQLLADAATQGDVLQSRASELAIELAEQNRRDMARSALRELIDRQAADLGMRPQTAETTLAEAARLIGAEIQARELALAAQQARWREARVLLDEIGTLRQAAQNAWSDLVATRSRYERLSQAKNEADLRIEAAKAVAARARSLRTDIVRQVFNDELNAVWRDLFIRLAPEERFVPAFALPDSVAGPVEAVLETHYRSGGKGGDPRSMLSAGNLNTSALTLFLALHLSVAPILPLLVIDDPVQSMDEVHIAQFAALLRTLKRLDRQVIIAVHERALFDYLALELSPAFNGDRLITVDLSRGPEGDTKIAWNPRTYQIDKAIAA